ncbi:MAG TPA: ChaN family lipoprotein [Deferrisomatales bacterium]|nr:ChaN family lipoprotein [Deferrisomatales bacterium]
MTLRAASKILGTILMLIGVLHHSATAEELLFRVSNAGIVSMQDMVADLRKARIVIVGEQHDNRDHHEAQLAVIRALRDSGASVAVGLEMFRSDAQPKLDAWVSGSLGLAAFVEVYADNWDTSYWPLYRDIFFYAREAGIPLVGLNVPRSVVSQVARRGFASLDEDQRQQLGGIQCDVDAKYRDLLGQVMGFKEGNTPTFSRFCEAQVVWDTAMGRNAAQYAQEHPNTVVVVLAGNFHAWKYGIAKQVREHADLPVRVILPSSDTGFFRYDIVLEDADYVWWHP